MNSHQWQSRELAKEEESFCGAASKQEMMVGSRVASHA